MEASSVIQPLEDMVASERRTVAIREEEQQKERLDLIFRQLTGQDIAGNPLVLSFHHINEYFEPARILVASYIMESFGLATTDFKVQFDVVPVERGGFREDGTLLNGDANSSAFDESNQWVPVLNGQANLYAPTLVISLFGHSLQQSRDTWGLLHERLCLKVFKCNPSYQKPAYKFLFRESEEVRWFPPRCILQFEPPDKVIFRADGCYEFPSPTEKAFQTVDKLKMAFRSKFKSLAPCVEDTFGNSLGSHASITADLIIISATPPGSHPERQWPRPPAIPFITIDCILNHDKDSDLIPAHIQSAKETFTTMMENNECNLPNHDWNNIFGLRIRYMSVSVHGTKVLREQWVWPRCVYLPDGDRMGYLWAWSLSMEKWTC